MIPDELLNVMANAMLDPKININPSSSGNKVRKEVLRRAVQAALDQGWIFNKITINFKVGDRVEIIAVMPELNSNLIGCLATVLSFNPDKTVNVFVSSQKCGITVPAECLQLKPIMSL